MQSVRAQDETPMTRGPAATSVVISGIGNCPTIIYHHSTERNVGKPRNYFCRITRMAYTFDWRKQERHTDNVFVFMFTLLIMCALVFTVYCTKLILILIHH